FNFQKQKIPKRWGFKVIATGFEPVTVCLEGRCSIQLSYATIDKQKNRTVCPVFVGVAGFEPAASCSQSRRDNRATLHPVNSNYYCSLYFGVLLNSICGETGTRTLATLPSTD